MADVHERLTRFELGQPKAAPAPAPSFADRIAKRAQEEGSRREAVEAEAERGRRESLAVRDSYAGELVRLLDSCERSATVANDTLSSTSTEITVERERESVALTRGKYTMVVRHHQSYFFSGAPYALALGSERTDWRGNDVRVLTTAKLELGVQGSRFVWTFGGRAMDAQAAAEWAVEWLFRP